MQILKVKLAELQRQEREAELDAIRGVQHSVGFGSQIRSYVLQPYQMVKDLRDEYETGNVDGVLDGDLDPFMEAYLRWQRAEGETPRERDRDVTDDEAPGGDPNGPGAASNLIAT